MALLWVPNSSTNKTASKFSDELKKKTRKPLQLDGKPRENKSGIVLSLPSPYKLQKHLLDKHLVYIDDKGGNFSLCFGIKLVWF